MMRALFRTFLLATTVLALAACGFHLRGSARLPAGMQNVYLTVSGDSAFQRALARSLSASGTNVVAQPGPGVAELRVSRADFSNNALTITGQGRISEYAVSLHVTFDVVDHADHTIVVPQNITMRREFTYDPSQAVGRATQIQALRESLVRDMVQAVMFRLQAAVEHPAAPASTGG